MTKIVTSAAAMALAVAALAGTAGAQTPNQITAQLNRAQLQGRPLYSAAATQAAPQPYPDIAVDTSPGTVTVVGAPTSTSSFGEPDTNPPSAGTPTVSTPFATVVPAPEAANAAKGEINDPGPHNTQVDPNWHTETTPGS